MTARPFSSLLVANRGEIACRIMRTARRLGLRTVAVYSEADVDALHVRAADEAVCIGPAAASASYLRIDRIIAAARACGADAVHPGYGFLSENAAFAAACEEAGLVFVGPAEASIRAMASKAAARTLMEQAGVPILPGYHGETQDDAALASAAHAIGFPLLIKPVSGGGGKGMRIVAGPGELGQALGGARREASRSFGDDRLLLEKFVTAGRHIEVQVFGDTQGNAVTLFERDCTLQRRHQKVIEEAPSPALDEGRRQAMLAAARKAVRAIDYIGAGTVEFMVDEGGFHFLEMNTRLQVEHPVTELITGVDLVEWQLRVAAGEALPLTQDAIPRRGHAIEARVYAEDPDRGLLPSGGRIVEWNMPLQSDHLRIDAGVQAGDLVTQHYDPLLAKVIVIAGDRPTALRRLDDALRDAAVSGIATNLALLRELLRQPAVQEGNFDTGFIERYLAHGDARPGPGTRDIAAACGAVLLREEAARGDEDESSPWLRSDGWMVCGTRRRNLSFLHRGRIFDATLLYTREGVQLQTASGTRPFRVAATGHGRFDVFHGRERRRATAAWSGRELVVATDEGTFTLFLVDPFEGRPAEHSGGNGLVAPMSGTVIRVAAETGATIGRGDPILVIESMKMEHTVRAPARGTVAALTCAVGAFVQQGDVLGEFERTSDAP